MKRYLKLVSVGLVMALLLCGLCACSKPDPQPGPSGKGNETIDKLLEDGYTMGLQTYNADTGILQIMFTASDFSDFIAIKCNMTEAKANEFLEIDYMAEDYDALCSQFLADYEFTSTSYKDKIPAHSEFDVFVGKPVQALLDAGYEQCGAGNDDNEILYLEYSNDQYIVRMYTEKEFEALFDMMEYDINALTIKSVSFAGFVNDITAEE